MGIQCENGNCIDSINSYTCDCYSGWEGQHCEMDTDYCNPNPCNSNGTLRCEDGNATFTCVCISGFSGITCSDMVFCTTDFCMNGGTCREQGGSGMLSPVSCDCLPNFTGQQCETSLLQLTLTSIIASSQSMDVTATISISPSVPATLETSKQKTSQLLTQSTAQSTFTAQSTGTAPHHTTINTTPHHAITLGSAIKTTFTKLSHPAVCNTNFPPKEVSTKKAIWVQQLNCCLHV